MGRLEALMVLAVLGVAAAQSPCCTPDAWEAKIREHSGQDFSGTARMKYTSADVYYDFTNKRFASTTFESYNDGSARVYRMISLREENKAYLIENGRCEVFDHPAGEMQRICVPEDATFERTIYFGAGTSTLEMDVFSYDEKDIRGQPIGKGEMAVTKEGCIPVTILNYTERRFSETESYLDATGGEFTNVHPGIKDPAVFQPPAECQTAKVGRAMPDALKNHFVWNLF